MTWINDIKTTLIELGGQAHLSDIYRIMKKLRCERNDTHVELESCVRCTLEQNSRGKGKDLFEPVFPVEYKRGIWRLKRKTP